jgi:aliphatic sulfonates family ABC transporter substrate-binding protein
MLGRRAFTAALLGTAAVAAGESRAAGPGVRIGYQKTGTLVILRQQQRLEKLGWSVRWVEFQSGPPLLEALNAGAVDFGATGDTPPVFAQAAGVDLVYVASQPASGRNAAILVHADSPIRSVADLRGRRLAVTKGSSAHYQTVRTLATAGLTLADVQPVFLQPADAGAAFRTGAVDAWTIWDPFYAIAEREPGVRVLITGEVAPSNSFFLARRDVAVRQPDLVVGLLREINAAAAWSEEHRDELARIMAEVTGVDEAAQRVAAARGTYRVAFMDDAVTAQQQALADTFAGLGVLPRRIDVRGAVWLPPAERADLGGKR